jgi:hypothetical protein
VIDGKIFKKGRFMRNIKRKILIVTAYARGKSGIKVELFSEAKNSEKTSEKFMLKTDGWRMLFG